MMNNESKRPIQNIHKKFKLNDRQRQEWRMNGTDGKKATKTFN